jgi:branched-chain amino acid transport system substrate-binding protein
MRLAVKEINARGGVHGRKFELLGEDDKYSPPQTVAAAKKLIYRDKVFLLFGNTGTAHASSITPMVEKEKVPFLWPSTCASKVFEPMHRYIFSIMTTYESEGRLHADYAAYIVKNPRVFPMYMEADMGKYTKNAMVDQLSKYGINTVGEANHKPTTLDFSSHVLKAYDAKANVIPIYTIAQPAARILLECKKINYKPLFLLFSSDNHDEILELAGDVLEGQVGTTVFAIKKTPHTEIRKFLDLAKKEWGKKDDMEIKDVEMVGYFYVWNIAKAFEKAGRNLTRENLVKTLESYNNVDTVIFGPVTFSPTRRIGAEKCIMLTYKNRQFEYLVPGWHTYRRF